MKAGIRRAKAPSRGNVERRGRMSWEPEVEELRRREELARRMGGPEKVARQHAAGRLTVRERLGALLDPGSFHEVGMLAGQARYQDGQLADFLPTNFVMGRGKVQGRPVVVGGDDFTVRGGAADAAIYQTRVSPFRPPICGWPPRDERAPLGFYASCRIHWPDPKRPPWPRPAEPRG